MNFCLILIFLNFVFEIKTQDELVNVISDDKHLYDFQGCHCHYTFDSNPEKEIQTNIEELKNKIDLIEESIYKLSSSLETKIDRIEESIYKLTEIFLNTTMKRETELKNELHEDLFLQNALEVHQTENALSFELVKDTEFEKIEKFHGDPEPTFDEHFNCIENCNKTSTNQIDCNEALTDKTKEDGVYVLNINKNGFQPFGAYCMRGNEGENGWTIIQRRSDGLENFYRNWSDYKYGFGNLSGSYWIGLERLHALTSTKSYELTIYWESRSNMKQYARYAEFYISSESEGYKLSVSGYSGNAGDSMRFYNENRFSTFVDEKDEIGHNSLCAEQTKSAWWYQQCNYSWRYISLNGEYRPIGPNGVGIYWYGSGYNSLKYVHMAIRPV